jgi:hypothetical protein
MSLIQLFTYQHSLILVKKMVIFIQIAYLLEKRRISKLFVREKELQYLRYAIFKVLFTMPHYFEIR